MKIIALYSIKGGVGKTATAVNLAYLAACEQRQTLLVDLDPQGSTSFYFRIRPPKKLTSRTLIQGGSKLKKAIRGSDYDYLDLLPADFSFRHLDISFTRAKKSKKRLKKVLGHLESEYDLLMIDSPPNITLVSENIIRAADILLVPLIPTILSVLAFEKLLQFYHKSAMDDHQIIAFFSMVESRKKLHREIMAEFSHRDQHCLQSSIPYASVVEKMGQYRQPVIYYAPRSRASEAYRSLWREINELPFIW